MTLGLGVTHNVPLLHCVRDVRPASCLPQLHAAVLDELMGLSIGSLKTQCCPVRIQELLVLKSKLELTEQK